MDENEIKYALLFKRDLDEYVTKDIDKIILKRPGFETRPFDQLRKSLKTELKNILNVPKYTMNSEIQNFENEIEKTLKIRELPSRPCLSKKKRFMKNYSRGIFQPIYHIPGNFDSFLDDLYESEMADNLYQINEFRKLIDLEFPDDSIIFEFKIDDKDVSKIIEVNQNQFFESLGKLSRKRKQPSIQLQPNKVVITEYQNNLKNDYLLDGKFDHSLSISSKNKSCNSYLFKPELFDNLSCTFECKNLDVEQSNESGPKVISVVLTKTSTINQYQKKSSRKRKQPFETLPPNKIVITASWINNKKKIKEPYCKPDLHTKMSTNEDDNIFNQNVPLKNETYIIRSSQVLMEHLYCSFQINDVNSEKTEGLKISEIEPEENAAVVTNYNYLDEMKNTMPIYAENWDELEQLENSYQKLTISENHNSSTH